MPLFSADDYDCSPAFEECWSRLPIIRRIGGWEVRWLAPLVDLGYESWIGDMSEGAWGYLEDCGWQAAMTGCGPMLDKRGRLKPKWVSAFCDAVVRLKDAGEYAGPEGDGDRWASWLCFKLSEPHGILAAKAKKRGWDR